MTAQANFTLGNPKAPNVLYISATPGDNDVTLALTSSADVTFTNTTLVPYSSAGSATGSLLYLDLTPLGIDSGTLKTFTLDAKGWTSVAYPDTGMIALTPAAPVSLKANTPLSFKLNKFVLPQWSGGPTTLALSIFHVTGLATGLFPAQAETPIALVVPSDAGKDLHEALSVKIDPDSVVASGTDHRTANTLTITLSQKDGAPTVLAGDDTVFTLSVVYAEDANGFGALMNAAEGNAISIPVPLGSGWTTSNVPGLRGRSWQLRPKSGQALPGPDGAPVSFTFAPVVTRFQSGPTVALLTYSKVTGYKDGAFAITLLKEPHVHIKSLTVEPALNELTDGNASVTLSWNVTDATALILDPGRVRLTENTGTRKTKIQKTTHFTLNAYGAGGIGADNYDIANVTATVVPVLDVLAAAPGAVSLDDFDAGGAPVTLDWAINTAQTAQLQLSSSVQGVLGQSYSRIGSVVETISEPQTFTLSIIGDTDPLHVWDVYVPAFQLQLEQQIGSGPFSGAAAAPGASYVAVCAPNSNEVRILSTASYRTIATIPVGGAPNSIAFAADGSRFFVASGDGTITEIVVTRTDQTPPWSFQPGRTAKVGGAPTAIALGSDGVLYVAVNKGTSSGSLACVTLGVKLAIETVTVGVGPAGVAVSPSGAQIFVSNTTDGTVSQIGRALDGTHQLIRTLPTLPGAQGIAVTPNGKRLLVGCNNGTLQVFDATAPDTTPATVVQVGGHPAALALDATGSYAFVLDPGSTRLSVVSLAKAKVIGTPVQVPAGSAGIAVSPDGMIALLSGTQLGVMVLATYAASTTASNCGGLVSDVAVTADNSKVLVWANAAIHVARSQPAPGLCVYDVASQTTTPMLTDRKIIDIATPTTAGSNTGFMSVLALSGLLPLDCTTFQTGNQLTVPPKGGGPARQPIGVACSADGHTAFTVVSDGANAYSLVVFVEGPNAFQVAADVPLYTTTRKPLHIPLAAAPDGSAAYVYDTTAGKLYVVTRDNAGNFKLAPQPLAAPGMTGAGLVVSRDATRAYLATQQGIQTILYVVDTAAQTIRPFPLSEPASTLQIRNMAISPDGARIFATDSIGGAVRVIDARSLRFLQTINWPAGLVGPGGVAVSGDQARLFVATDGGTLASANQIRPAPRRSVRAVRSAAMLGATAGQPPNGVFIRHQLGDSPGHNGGSFSGCPDIVLSTNASNAPDPVDPTTLITDANYAKDYGPYVTQGAYNYVYLRALNNAASLNPVPKMNPRLWFAYTPSDLTFALNPNKWLTTNISVDGAQGQSANWQDSTIIYAPATPGQLMATGKAFLWKPDLLTDGHYCLISMAENPFNPQDAPVMPNPGNLASFDDLVRFVLTNDWFGWRNTVAVAGWDAEWTKSFPITGPQEESDADVGIQCVDMPTDGFFQFQVMGPHGTFKPKDGVDSGKLPILKPDQKFTMPMTFPAKFNTEIIISYFRGKTQPPTGSKIIAYLGSDATSVVRRMRNVSIKRRPVEAWRLATAMSEGGWHKTHPFGSMTFVY